LILMLSTVLTEHRFRIMRLTSEQSRSAVSGLYIGVGSGIEIEITRGKNKHCTAHDLSISNFCKEKHKHVQFIEREFTGGEAGMRYDQIYLIEILEHIPDPFELISLCFSSLNPGGQILLTTATDIPQFDHVYNFDSEHTEFEKIILGKGLEIVHWEDLQHRYMIKAIDAKNRFYTLRRP